MHSITILDLTGKPIRTAHFFGGIPGAKREWIIASVCDEFECTEDDVTCTEPDESSLTGRDVIMVRGAAVGEIG